MKKTSPVTTLGERIKKLRKAQKMTQKTLCGDKLSERYLSDIENNIANPSMDILEHIAKILNTTSGALLWENSPVPQMYLELRNKLFRLTVYDDFNRVSQRERLISQIKKDFYSKLPLEEKETIDILEATWQVNYQKKLSLADKIIKPNLDRLLSAKQYTLNDLLKIKLIFCYHLKKKIPAKYLTVLLQNVTRESERLADKEALLSIQILISGMSFFNHDKKYHEFKPLIDKTYKLMKENEDFQKKPVVDMVHGKYLLFHEKKFKEAKTLYEQAINLANLTDNNFLAQKIAEEWKLDETKFQSS